MNFTISKSAPEKPEATAAFEKSVQSMGASQPYRKSASVSRICPRCDEPNVEDCCRGYKAAIANNKFVELIEYQDSRGFVLYAEDLQNIADQMSQKRPEDHKVIAAETGRTQAWPAVNPPATPVKTPRSLRAYWGLNYAANGSFPGWG